MHVHGYPDILPGLPYRGDDLQTMRLAHAYGISGWVLKSHLWITTDRARLLQEQASDLGFTICGSVTLNPAVGGLSATVVELAAAHGARMVFLPTWGAAADVARGSYITKLITAEIPSFEKYAADNAISVLGTGGHLTSAATGVIDACHELGLALATGHVSLAESLAVAQYCAQIGEQLLVSHPLHYVSEPAELRAFTDLGAYVEFCNSPLLHPDGHLTIQQIHAAMQAVGAEHVILSTDAFSRFAPPQPECLRVFAEQLSYLGWAPTDLRKMLVVNPRNLLGIEPGAPTTAPHGAPGV